MSLIKCDEDSRPYRYSTCAYFDVLTYSDAEHEAICDEIQKLINSHPFTNNVNVQEV